MRAYVLHNSSFDDIVADFDEEIEKLSQNFYCNVVEQDMNINISILNEYDTVYVERTWYDDIDDYTYHFGVSLDGLSAEDSNQWKYMTIIEIK